MVDQVNLKEFNKIYDDTYQDVLKYVICKCSNINDVSDILQETYFELWRILNKKDLIDKNIKSFIIGIAINKIKKHYSILYKFQTISLFSNKDNNIELVDTIEDKVDIELLTLNKIESEKVWEYLKNMSNQNIPKIFYFHYCLDMTIKDIAEYCKCHNFFL